MQACWESDIVQYANIIDRNGQAEALSVAWPTSMTGGSAEQVCLMSAGFVAIATLMVGLASLIGRASPLYRLANTADWVCQ